MTVTAIAINDNGLSGTITDNVSKTNSYGSTIFEGNAKVSGSAEDYGFWKVEKVVDLSRFEINYDEKIIDLTPEEETEENIEAEED
jgi:hypothetical protein